MKNELVIKIFERALEEVPTDANWCQGSRAKFDHEDDTLKHCALGMLEIVMPASIIDISLEIELLSILAKEMINIVGEEYFPVYDPYNHVEVNTDLSPQFIIASVNNTTDYNVVRKAFENAIKRLKGVDMPKIIAKKDYFDDVRMHVQDVSRLSEEFASEMLDKNIEYVVQNYTLGIHSRETASEMLYLFSKGLTKRSGEAYQKCIAGNFDMEKTGVVFIEQGNVTYYPAKEE